MFLLWTRTSPSRLWLTVLPRESLPELSSALSPCAGRDCDIRLEITDHTVAADRPGLFLSRDVEVVETEGTVMVRLLAARAFELLDVFADTLANVVVNGFRLLFADRPHMPRVKVDHLVLSRGELAVQPG